jgi:2-amino-4-hydroxy-6-hydroxymethyldihydropteridine diphosphokinase
VTKVMDPRLSSWNVNGSAKNVAEFYEFRTAPALCDVISRSTTKRPAIMPDLVYISLGSNIGDRENHLRDAIARLGREGRVVSVSSFYETEPVEFTEQAWFLNCAVALETMQTPEHLMAALLNIEQEMGRRRIQRKGPRVIDIDILLFSDTVIDLPELTIPHPAMLQRRFVLQPLAEIAPKLPHPVLMKTIRQLLDALPAGQTVRKLKTN